MSVKVLKQKVKRNSAVIVLKRGGRTITYISDFRTVAAKSSDLFIYSIQSYLFLRHVQL